MSPLPCLVLFYSHSVTLCVCNAISFYSESSFFTPKSAFLQRDSPHPMPTTNPSSNSSSTMFLQYFYLLSIFRFSFLLYINQSSFRSASIIFPTCIVRHTNKEPNLSSSLILDNYYPTTTHYRIYSFLFFLHANSYLPFISRCTTYL